jgi:hypothetical protein
MTHEDERTGKGHRFGGDWTTAKLEVLAGYLSSYTTALKDKPTPDPLGIGVNRLLTKSGDIPESWRRRLNMLLGTEDWYDEFYKVETTPTLFGGEQERLVKATMSTIGRYFNERLKTLFAGVADEPGVLRNSANNPLYLLCFAAGNERGDPVALRIASHLLKELR